MARRSLAVVIPCHNEAATLAGVVKGIGPHADVLLVDDSSTDASPEIAAAHGARVLRAATAGYDGALDTGLRQALADGYNWVVTMDADGEHEPGLVAHFLRCLEQGAPLVLGVRPHPQRAAEYIVAAIGRALFGFHDLLCGMKGYSREVLERHYARGAPLAINMAPAINWRRAGGAFVELAVTGTPRIDRPRFARAMAANGKILKAFWQALAEPQTYKADSK